MATLKNLLSTKTDQQLLYYIHYPEKHTEEGVAAALEELRSRGLVLPENIDLVLNEKTQVLRAKRNPLSQKEKDDLFRQTLIFSVCYVGLATVCVLFVKTASVVIAGLLSIGVLLTLPVSAISLTIVHGESYEVFTVLIVQFLHFFGFWFFSYNVLFSIRRWQKS
jgi:hypothetical protein